MKRIVIICLLAVTVGVAAGWVTNWIMYCGVSERFVPYSEGETPAELVPPPGFDE